MSNSQNQLVLQHLKSGMALDPLTALKEYGIFRLAARVFDLRGMGHDILATPTEVKKRGGKTAIVCFYRLMPKRRKKNV